jgi:hypothetical protein
MKSSTLVIWFVISVSLAAAVLPGAPTARAQTCIPPPPGMVGWWPGDGNANDIVDEQWNADRERALYTRRGGSGI